MIHRPHLHRLAPAALALTGAALVAGCASTPTRFFTLDPVAAAQSVASGYDGPALKVAAVHIPPELDREELVDETRPGEIKVHDFEHWSAPLGLSARQVLVQDLAARLPAGRVLGPDSPGGAQIATLSVDVVAFRSGASGATMQASWSVVLPAAPGATGAPVVLRSPLQLLQGPAEPDGGAGVARSFSALLGQLSDQIAAGLPGRIQEAVAREAERQAEAAARVQTTTRTQTTTHVKLSASPF